MRGKASGRKGGASGVGLLWFDGKRSLRAWSRIGKTHAA